MGITVLKSRKYYNLDIKMVAKIVRVMSDVTWGGKMIYKLKKRG